MKKLNIDEFIYLAKSIPEHSIYDYSKSVYIKSIIDIEILCTIHNSYFWIKPNNHLSKKQGCPICSSEKVSINNRKSLEQFRLESKNIYNDKYILESPHKYKNNNTILDFKCIVHNSYFKQTPKNHLKHIGCINCRKEICSKRMKSTETFRLEAESIHWYDYKNSIYTGCHNKLEIECPIHGIFKQTPAKHIYDKQGCPKCNKSFSKGEHRIEEILNKLNINHIREHRIDDSLLKFDFYLPYHNMCIEYDGIQHFEPIEQFGGIIEYNKRIIRDERKNKICMELDIYLLRISYKDYNKIESIINRSVLILINRRTDSFI